MIEMRKILGSFNDKQLMVALIMAIVFLGLSILISGYWISKAIEFIAYQL